MTEHMTAEAFRERMGRKRQRQPKRDIPETMTGDELRNYLDPGELDDQCRAAGLPVPVRELQFHPTRKWRFDFAFSDVGQDHKKVAVEIDGGIWMDDGKGGRHNRGNGAIRDMEKLNAAAAMSWVVLRFTPDQVRNGTALNELREVLK